MSETENKYWIKWKFETLPIPAMLLLTYILLTFFVRASLALPVGEDGLMHRDIRHVPESELPRLVIYFQTTHDSSTGEPISMLPLITEKHITLTHLIVCSFHISATSDIRLNDYSPYDPHFYTLWNETVILQNSGVRIMGMVGGAAAGSFETSTLDGDDTTFEYYYARLHDAIAYYGLQGMDVDVEQSMSQAGIARLVSRLSTDFGPDFEVTLAPVASALGSTEASGANLSGFNYAILEQTEAANIAFYNAQFYNGFGTMATPSDFEAVVQYGWSPSKVLMGQITTPANGYDYVPYETFNATVVSLRQNYGELGGVMGWEYFNSAPGGTSAPWEWAQEMTAILRPDQQVTLTVTREDADRLTTAWRDGTGGNMQHNSQPNIDYAAMANA